MPTKNILRILVVIQAAVWIGQRVSISLVAPELFGKPGASFPPLAVLFGERGDLLAFLILFIGLAGVGIGLGVFSKVARPLYVAVNLVAILAASVHGPLARSGSMDFFHGANILLTGVIFMMIYSWPLKEQYEGAKLQTATAQFRAGIPDSSERRERFCQVCGAPNHGTKFCAQCGKSML